VNCNKEVKEKKQTASLDRIDSTKGYIKGNIQWVHKDVNKMKWNWNQSNFINWCKLITNYYNEKENSKTD
jgi:hypothetical protein